MANPDPKATPPSGPTISVAMATYNGDRFLREQLDSIAAQTRAPHELVVSDDGSTDRTLEIVREFSASAPFPVKLLQDERRLNYRLNFRRAAQNCSGDLIAFSDQDDVWQTDKLEKMARAFADPAILLAYHNAIVSSEGGTRNLYSAGEEEAALKEKPLSPFKSPSGFLMVFRSDLRRFDDLWDLTIDQNEGNVIFAHDQWYFFLARALGEVRFVDEPLAIYRQHGGNTYGVPVSYSIGQRLARRLIHYGTADEWAALSAKSRATILRLIAERDGLARLGQLAQSYDDLAERRARRAKTYCRDSVAKRAAALLRSISAADYRGGAWAFEPASIARDAWSGVVQGKCKDPTRGC